MQYEVELKFRLDHPAEVESQLRGLGVVDYATVEHLDRYYNHPCRDFRETDEAFRIRTIGNLNRVTYKGAVQGAVAKTRHEIEVPIADGLEAAGEFDQILTLLGFRMVREVKKTRTSCSLSWNDHVYELALDTVPTLGRFLEIELMAEAEGRDQAEQAVWQLARALGLPTAEPRSYLDLLIEADGMIR